MIKRVFWKRGLLLLMALLVVLVMTATPAFAIVQGIKPPGGGLITPLNLATGVTLNENTLTLTENQMISAPTPTATLTATVTPSGASQTVTWSSGNTNVATVSNGVVTAAGPGTTTITVTPADGIGPATCTVTVQVLQVLGGATDATGKTVIVTFTVPMAPPPSGSAGFIVERTVADIVDNVTGVTLDSSNSDAYDLTLATPVQYKQLVQLGYLPGTLQTASGISLPEFSLLSVHNTVPEVVPVTGVALNTKTLNLTVGGPTVTLTATVIPPSATNTVVNWISDTPGVATVNNGVVSAVAAGTANITVTTADGQTSTCAVTVTAAAATVPTATSAPSVTGVSPNSGSTAGDTTVTITGSGFTGATAVNFGSTTTSFSFVNDTTITATSPAGNAGAVDVTVVTPGGASATSSNDQFTYTTTTPATGQTVLQFYIGSTNYDVNNQAQPMDVAPVISDGRTLLPITYVATPLGATVNWDPAQQMVTVTLGSKTIQLVIGQGSATVNGATVPIDSTNPDVTPVIIPPGRTMLPLRFIAENLGCQVDWNGSAQEVTVTYPQP